jgi:hypothetical protein
MLFVVAENIPGKPNAWREIVDVLLGHAEKVVAERDSSSSEVRHGVDSLFIVITRIVMNS